MVSSGVTNGKNVKPILVDSSGRPYVILDDGSGNTTPAGDAVGRPIFVKVTDGSQVLELDAASRAYVNIGIARPDGTNIQPSGDDKTRPIYVKLADGTDQAIIETDDDNIAISQKTLATINLNYEYDSANTKWVRQTPSSPVWNWNALENSGVTFAGTWATGDGTNRWLGRYFGNIASNAINDKVGLGHFYVPAAADYTVRMIGTRGTNYGKTHFIINGTDEGNIDWYGTLLYNHVASVSLGTLTAGIKILSIDVASKNGSSSDYNVAFESIAIHKT